MSRTSKPSRSSLNFVLLACALAGCKPRVDADSAALAAGGAPRDVAPAEGEVLITILGTNDIHGGLEAQVVQGGETGGLAYWAGVVDDVRETNAAEFPDRSATVVIDSGDQFQGTLVSNFNEGKAVFEAFAAIGYDAVVPGNHDYDFGPQGWLEDVVLPATPPDLADKRGALKAAIAAAPLPLVSANTYLRASVANGEVSNARCVPASGEAVDWSKTQRPDYVKPYVVKEAAGLKIAIIGFDNVKTYETTQGSNVSDLCFRDVFETYLDVRKELEGKADVFIMAAHEGNLPTGGAFKKDLRDFLTAHPGAIDAVVAAHSHQVERYDVDGVPVIQSGSGGTMYGRIDLIFDVAKHRLEPSRTRFASGIALRHEGDDDDRAIEPSAKVQAIIAAARAESSQLGSRPIGSAVAEVKRSRTSESPLANALTDQLRLATGADVVFINSATVRDTLPKSTKLTYENLFKVLPFSSRTVRLKPLSASQLAELALVAVQESGEYGILCFSGMRIEHSGSGAQAKLAKVTLSDGKVLFDQTSGGLQPSTKQFTVLALDFIVDPVSGVRFLKDLPRDQDIGVFRELVATHLFAQPLAFPKAIDGRIRKL